MENCEMSGKSQGILKWMISGNPVMVWDSRLTLEKDILFQWLKKNNKYAVVSRFQPLKCKKQTAKFRSVKLKKKKIVWAISYYLLKD